jgi:outer membrane murein-binding lipoprotein Lpp
MAGPIVPNVFTEAADEIERLRGGGCVRDQRTTQYCAEAVRLQARVWQLEGDASALAERLTAERDEARRMVCSHEADLMEDMIEHAKHRGWDCFKEDAK